ncbi:hypothetical protein L226DRAFT_571287 [Lentinus tigrinus ALCF2SS1-7]|uniref:F-box domain-containing protein n=1 Tax=Lentinus tigrinus ALCF2SS1-6 TaxID=1328759 RepID=A0A5C2SFA8_9APHY|nr:hypothetical protein L227DRAFT_42683 [Lentinus tigrinus ALCF2SS1-6]RPD74378.1 hypothetical protein L226DRAFT_571287 [Lentinus tigrinus ALCF2SS1-7]
MALAALPVELLDAVLAPLTAAPPALAAAARTCSALNPAAIRLLYRHLSLSAYARNLSLIHLLAASPNLARLVRTFSIHLDDAEPAVLPTYSDLQCALHLMTNLSSLALYVDASTSWILSPPEGESGQKSGDVTIHGPPFHPRLEHLTCNFPLDAHLASFLGQVPSLISLTLSSFVSDTDPESDSGHAPPPNHVHIPSSHLPLLEAYTGPAHLLPTLASRPLKAVLLSGDLTLDLLPTAGAPCQDAMMSRLRGKFPAADRLPNADSQLQVLSAMTSAPPADLLESLAIAFPNIVCLRLMTTRSLWDLPDLEFYSRIASTLESLPRLTSFELAGIHWQSRAKPSSSEAKIEEKEWVSPPVTPRAALPDVDDEFEADRDYDFDGAFLDWSY